MREKHDVSSRYIGVLTLLPMVVAGWFPCNCHGQGASDSYPAKPVKLIVPLATGGSVDSTARLLAIRLSEILHRQFVVENRLGAAGTIAFTMIAKSPPDGYTLLVAGTGFSTVPALTPNLAYDPIKDFSPITQLNRSSYVLVVHPSLPVKSTRELIALAKAKPGSITYGSSGVGSGVHFAEELFKTMARANMLHVPYKGAGEAQIDLIAGRIDMMIGGILSALPQAKNGRLRLLAVSTSQRSVILPDIPTIAESGLPGYDASAWIGLLGPQGLPQEVVNRLSVATKDALKDSGIVKKMMDDGGEPAANGPDAFRQLIVVDVTRYIKIAKDSGMTGNAGN